MSDPSVRAAPRPAVTAAILAAYALAILLRMPQIVLKGRFWAEEGTVFYANAWRLDPVHDLFLPYGGYLNILANGATLLARWTLPVVDAPYLTIAVALLCQLVPPFLLLSAPDGWLRPWPVRAAGLLMLLTVPASDEIWLQSLHCQFELALACGLLLALEPPRGGRAAVALPALFLAPLCGPGSIALLPLFLLRAAVERTRARALAACVLGIGSALQLGLFFGGGSGRGLTLDPALLLAVVSVKDLLVPIIGVYTAGGPAARLHAAASAGHVPLLAVVAPVAVFGALAFVALRGRNWPALWLLAGAATAALVSYAGALDGTIALLDARAGARYALVPLSLTALSVLALATRPPWRLAGAAICLWLLVVGVRDYTIPWIPVKDGPAWAAEVAHWRADPAYVMQLWPRPWTLRLPAP